MPDVHLNLGCGPVRFRGEVGVDRHDTAACDVRGDLLALPIKSRCAAFVRMEHVLEHLPYRQCVPALFEAWRIIAPGGKLRIGVPDIKATCRAYISADSLWERSQLIRQLYGGQTHDGEFHRAGWDEETLADLLRSCGFAEISVWKDEVKDFWGASIIAEAVRPCLPV